MNLLLQNRFGEDFSIQSLIVLSLLGSCHSVYASAFAKTGDGQRPVETL